MTEQQGTAGRPTDGTVSWWEIQVDDLETAKAFYGAVFGWTFQHFSADFAICVHPDGGMVGGLEERAGEVAAPGRQVRVYVQTSDLEGVLARVVAAGGTVAQPRGVIGEEYGWFALVADPSGITIGLTTDRPAAVG